MEPLTFNHQIVKPSNYPTIRDSFVQIYFKKSTQITLAPSAEAAHLHRTACVAVLVSSCNRLRRRHESPTPSSPFPYRTSHSGQIIEPQLNRGSIRSPTQRSFVPIYLKESTRYHISNVSGVTLAPACNAGVARVLPKQSPGTTRQAFSRIPPPHTDRHHLFKTTTWISSNRKRLVPQLFLKSPQINNSNLVLIFPTPHASRSVFSAPEASASLSRSFAFPLCSFVFKPNLHFPLRVLRRGGLKPPSPTSAI
jgi:hypothetical protein